MSPVLKFEAVAAIEVYCDVLACKAFELERYSKALYL
jgi:hypothetical protein